MGRPDDREIWVAGPQGRSLCALVDGEVGWLMVLREPGDAGFSSRNPAYAGPVDAGIDFMLANGQRDKYPAAWTYPVETVMRAVAYFRSTGRRPPFIAWHDDSGDGEAPAPAVASD